MPVPRRATEPGRPRHRREVHPTHWLISTQAGIALGCLDLSPNYQYEWVIDAKRNTRNHDMRRAAVAAVDALSSYEEVAPRTDEHLPTWVEYESAPHVFTAPNLQKICEVEARFYGEPSYQKVCVMDDGACAAPAASALTAFYGADHLQRLARGNASCHLLDEATVAQTWLHMVAAANASTAGRLAHGMFMAKGAITTGLSPKTRSLLYVGAPLENFASTTDRTAEQYDAYQNYVEKVEKKLMTHFGVSGTLVRSAYLEPWVRDGLEFKAFSYLLQRLEWLRLQEMDSLWMAITICFVALWIRVHTGSAKFAAAATSQILLSIPVTALIYRYIVGFEYFAFLHLCSIFVVLGIGADDNFVLLDAWRQASTDVLVEDEAVLRRLLYAFDRARDAIFNTSLTTAVAFLCLGASPLMPVRTFGVFAAAVVVCNYVMVLTLMPCCVVLFEASHDVHKKRCNVDALIERFFERVYLPVMTATKRGVPVAAWASVLLFLGLGAYLGHRATLLEMPRGEEEFFPKQHMFTGFANSMARDYEVGASSEYTEVAYTFGVAGLKRENYDEYAPDYKRGEARWSGGFDMFAFRDELQGFCDAVRAAPCDQRECGMGRLHVPESTICFYEEFEAWKGSSLVNMTASDFYEDLGIFRETTYPGMMRGRDPDGRTWQDLIGFVDGQLRFVTVPTSLTMKVNGGIDLRREVINTVLDFVEDQRDSIKGLGHLTYDGGLQFMWCDTIEALREALFEGFEICFPIAFGVLVLATQNLLVSLYAIVGIALVVASVLGAAESVYGWDLGVIEALAGVMVIGFSVDYAIHLCHMYVEADKSGHSSRMDRFSYAVSKMGGTVVGGAATTLGAAALMLPCQLTFFYKLGLLIFTTIFCSLVFAFGFVMPLLAAAGPSGDWCGFSLPGQKRHHGGRVAAAPLEATPAP